MEHHQKKIAQDYSTKARVIKNVSNSNNFNNIMCDWTVNISFQNITYNYLKQQNEGIANYDHYKSNSP